MTEVTGRPSRTAEAVYKKSGVKKVGGEEETKITIEGNKPNASTEIRRRTRRAPCSVAEPRNGRSSSKRASAYIPRAWSGRKIMLAAPIPRIKRPRMIAPPGPAVLRKVTKIFEITC